MGKYVFEGKKEDIFMALRDNDIFSLTYQYDGSYGSQDMREKWTRILEEKSFEEIWNGILYSDYLHKGLSSDDIVFCMCPEKNRKSENLSQIYATVGYQSHGKEQPVFFVDTTFTTSRKDGVLFTTKGIYRKNRGMMPYSPYMPVDINERAKQIYIKDTLVLDYNGTKDVFMDIACLAHIVYIFNCIRHELGNSTYIAETKESTSSDSGATVKSAETDSISSGTKFSTFIWIVIIFFIIKACAGG